MPTDDDNLSRRSATRAATRRGSSRAESVALYNRQLREDRRWEREQRRRQRLAIALVTVIALVSGAFLILNRQQGGSTEQTASPAVLTPDGSQPSSAAATSTSPSPAATQEPLAYKIYGKPRSGLPWHSGIWTGGTQTTARTDAAGTWRGRPMDFATVYPPYATWAEISGSSYVVESLASFRGRLSYGLPLLPKNRAGKWQDILNGSHDYVFRAIAQQLKRNGHGDAAIRMGVEANGYWFPWAVTLATTDEFKAAFRRIEKVMSAVAPDLTFWLDLNCGTILTGSADRLAPLVDMYPGDDVVDGISMDHYNRYKLLAKDDASWQQAIAPSWAVGLSDGIAFARLHNKGFAVPEWGLDGVQGPGDSPYFIQKMHDLFVESSDVLVYENYFSEPDSYIKGDLFQTSQNPKSAALYRKLWGKGH